MDRGAWCSCSLGFLLGIFRAIQVEKEVIKYSFVPVGNGKARVCILKTKPEWQRPVFEEARCLVLTATLRAKNL